MYIYFKQYLKQRFYDPSEVNDISSVLAQLNFDLLTVNLLICVEVIPTVNCFRAIFTRIYNNC